MPSNRKGVTAVVLGATTATPHRALRRCGRREIEVCIPATVSSDLGLYLKLTSFALYALAKVVTIAACDLLCQCGLLVTAAMDLYERTSTTGACTPLGILMIAQPQHHKPYMPPKLETCRTATFIISMRKK
jgi:hypothetical protein